MRWIATIGINFGCILYYINRINVVLKRIVVEDIVVFTGGTAHCAVGGSFDLFSDGKSERTLHILNIDTHSCVVYKPYIVSVG